MDITLAQTVRLENAQSLDITTRAGTRFTLIERNGALYIQAPRRMFIQWSGNRAVEVFQIPAVQEDLCPKG